MNRAKRRLASALIATWLALGHPPAHAAPTVEIGPIVINNLSAWQGRYAHVFLVKAGYLIEVKGAQLEIAEIVAAAPRQLGRRSQEMGHFARFRWVQRDRAMVRNGRWAEARLTGSLIG